MLDTSVVIALRDGDSVVTEKAEAVDGAELISIVKNTLRGVRL